MKNWGNGKRLSNAAVSCLFDLLLIYLNSSSYSLAKPLILSSFGLSQVWSCNFLSWKGISGVRLTSREWFLEIYSWHLRKFNFFQQSSSNTLWSQGLCESILERKESKEAQVQLCILNAQQQETAQISPGCCMWVLPSVLCCDIQGLRLCLLCFSFLHG